MVEKLEVGKFYINGFDTVFECMYVGEKFAVLKYTNELDKLNLICCEVVVSNDTYKYYKEYIPVKTYIRYVNVYYSIYSNDIYFGSTHNTKIEAEAHVTGAIKARVRLEFTEGQFDD